MNLNEDLEDNYLYTAKEIAFLWNVSREWVRRKFTDEPGVLKLQEAPAPGKREYCPLRIPGHVARRVRDRMVVKARKYA
jgi:hypothetical protein